MISTQDTDDFENKKLRRKVVNFSQIDSDTRLKILKYALLKSCTHKDVAQIFGVRTSAVSKLCSDFKSQNPSIFNVPIQVNTESNRVLRCLYAQSMLPIYDSAKKVINIDES